MPNNKGFALVPVIIVSVIVCFLIVLFIYKNQSSVQPQNDEYVPQAFDNTWLIDQIPTASLYASKNLGLTFRHNGFVEEKENKIYVYANEKERESFSSIERFSKSHELSLEETIKQKYFTAKNMEEDCPLSIEPTVIQSVYNTEGNTYSKLRLFYKEDYSTVNVKNNESPVTTQKKCPPLAQRPGKISFFLTDSKHPDRYIYVHLGVGFKTLYTGDGSLQNAGYQWQDTIYFID